MLVHVSPWITDESALRQKCSPATPEEAQEIVN